MKRMPLDQDESNDSLINLTPLIDVVFVVLIMFIIIAPLVELDRINLASHKEESSISSPHVDGTSLIKIQVFNNNTIWINNKSIADDCLLSTLKTLNAHTPQTIPQVYHDKKAYFGTYQNIKNAIETAGFKQMDVILQPD